ncbi:MULTISPECIES: symporter small accessory protein [Sporomusa]
MLGLTDPWIAFAYLACFAATALCIFYSVRKGGE